MTRADMESATPKRQSVQAASVKLPAELSASDGVGMTRLAMMGDQSLRKARSEMGATKVQAGSANVVCPTFVCRRDEPYGSPSRNVA